MNNDQPTDKPGIAATTAICPRCKREVGTKQQGDHKRVFTTHGPDPNGSFFCGNSGSRVMPNLHPDLRRRPARTGPGD